MPEGPEVTRSAEQLNAFAGREILSFQAVGGRYAKRPIPLLDVLQSLISAGAGYKLSCVKNKGKFMWWELVSDVPDAPQLSLWCTYGMSGQWHVSSPEKHTAAIVVLSGEPNATLSFTDPRHFGTLSICDDPDELAFKIASLGPDMLNDPPTVEEFVSRLRRWNRKTLSEVLMDQRALSGVGNYIKCESLWRARLSPHRLVVDTSACQLAELWQAIKDVMIQSYALGGSTLSTYRNVDGSVGKGQMVFDVYDKPIDSLGNAVIRDETLDGRTTHWVPSIQH